MKQSKTEIEGGSTVKNTKYAFLPPGTIGKERGRGRGRGLGLRSMCSPRLSMNEARSTFHQTALCANQAKQNTKMNCLVPEKEQFQFDTHLTPTTELLSQLSKKKNSLVPENELMQTNVRMSPSINQLQLSNKKSVVASEKNVKETGIQLPPSTDHELHHIKKRNSLFSDKELLQNDVQLPPSTVQTTQHTQSVETSSCTTGKVKRVRGRNKCKEVASLEVEKKLELTFYNNRTIGDTNKSFSRHLGIIVRDRNMCPLGVCSRDDIPEEKLNHMWAAVVDKFKSDDIDNHIFKWMREIWNKWRGYLHATYVRDKPIQEALRNMLKGVDKKQWEWLVKEYFLAEIYQGGKEENPPDMATIFFETHKKNEQLVEPEAIEKHAQIQELVQSEPSLPTIEIVEKCFGPQSRSHVVGFGGGVKAKDMRDGTSSKAELLSQLRSSQAENQYLKDRLSTMENDVKDLKELKEFLLAQQSNVKSAPSHIVEE